MDAKEKAFRDSAKAEGYTDEQINAHLASVAKPATEPVLPTSNNYEDFANKEMPQARTAVSRMKESASDTGSIVPYAIGAGGAAAAAAAAVGGKKLYDTLTNKMQDSAKTESPKVASTPLQEPTFDWQNFTPKDVMGDNTPATPASQPEIAQKPTIADLQQKLGMNPAAPVAPEAPVAPVTSSAAVNPTPAEVVTNPAATPVEKAVTLTQETPAVVEAPKVAGAVEPLQTGTGKPAYAGEAPATNKFKSSYPDVKAVPQGYAFVPGAQAINTLRNNIGQETFTEHYTKNPYPTDYKEALQQGQDINKSLGRMTRDELKAAGIAPPNVVPGIGAQVGGVKGSRLIKVGGVTGMLVALSDLAKADSLTEAGLRGLDIATDYIPGVGSAKQALGSSTTNANEQEQLAYLRRMQAAKELGAGNRGKAFDPRIPYNSALSDIGIPPPYRR